MRYKSLTKWMKWVSDRERVAGVKEDGARGPCSSAPTGRRLQAGPDPHAAFNRLHADSQCSWTFPSHSSGVFSVGPTISQTSQQLHNIFWHQPALPNTHSCPQACTREGESWSERRVEPKVCSIIAMVFF